MAKPTLLNYRGQPITQPVLRLHDPLPTAPVLSPRVLPRVLRAANVVVGTLSAAAHGLPAVALVYLAVMMGGRPRAIELSAELLLFLLIAGGACSGLLLIAVSFARRRRWIFAWAAVEFAVTVGLCALVLAIAQGSSTGQYLLLRGFVSLIYTGVVVWAALPPERA